MEAHILQRLEEHTEEGKDISNREYGFRRGRSTIGALQGVVNMATNANNGLNGKKGFCALVCIDIRNTFNSARWKDIVRALDRK